MQNLIFECIIVFAVAFFVFLLNYTNFHIEYASLIKLGWVFNNKKYQIWLKENSLVVGWPIFIRVNYNNFFSRLIGCPICLITFNCFLVNLIIYIHSLVGGLYLAFLHIDLKQLVANYDIIFIFYIKSLFISLIFSSVISYFSCIAYMLIVNQYKQINKI